MWLGQGCGDMFSNRAFLSAKVLMQDVQVIILDIYFPAIGQAEAGTDTYLQMEDLEDLDGITQLDSARILGSETRRVLFNVFCNGWDNLNSLLSSK